MIRRTMVAIGLALAVGGCGANGSGNEGPGAGPPQPAPSSEAAPDGPLEGTWSTPPMSKAQHIVAAEAAGCSQQLIEEHFEDWPAGDIVHTLAFAGDLFVESVGIEGEPSVPGSDGTYSMPDPQTLALEEPCCGTLTFDATLEGDRLTLRLRGFGCTDDPAPAYIFQGAPFTRTS